MVCHINWLLAFDVVHILCNYYKIETVVSLKSLPICISFKNCTNHIPNGKSVCARVIFTAGWNRNKNGCFHVIIWQAGDQRRGGNTNINYLYFDPVVISWCQCLFEMTSLIWFFRRACIVWFVSICTMVHTIDAMFTWDRYIWNGKINRKLIFKYFNKRVRDRCQSMSF